MPLGVVEGRQVHFGGGCIEAILRVSPNTGSETSLNLADPRITTAAKDDGAHEGEQARNGREDVDAETAARK
jgi:hypothetical protein